MKKLITIILSLIMTFFAVPNQSADQPHVVAEKPPQSSISTTVEQVHDEGEKTAKTAFVGEVTENEIKIESPREETSEVQETVVEEIITETEEDIVVCIDEGDKSLAEYKPQIGGQLNPFENDTPTEIDDRPVEDYVGEGEDRPGEGKHF